jgi:acetyl-CoA carboxylase beta subunit
MLDLVVDRREMKATLSRILRFMRAEAAPAITVEREAVSRT